MPKCSKPMPIAQVQYKAIHALLRHDDDDDMDDDDMDDESFLRREEVYMDKKEEGR